MLVLGDSLSAEYGLSRGQGWVALLEKRLAADERTRRWQVVNASISGETTAGGKGRLPALLAQHRPKVVVIELGANDALRGLPLKATTANLRQMVADVQAAGARAVLVGLQVPPNYGPAYTRQFSQMFGKVAADTDSPLVPFLLEGFADDPDWFQADRIHPQAKAHPRMLDTVWAVLKDVL
nr:arylesterase [Lautropia dentalis]